MTTKNTTSKNVPTRFNILRIFKRFFIQTVIIIFLIFLFGSFELGRYTVYRSHPNLYTQDRASAVLQKIASLIRLPKETPTMAVINNATSAKKTQPFLAHANNGDILIVYKNAREVILYRPSNNKLISVGPIYRSQKTSTNTNQKTSLKTRSSIAPSQPKATTTQHAATTSQKK